MEMVEVKRNRPSAWDDNTQRQQDDDMPAPAGEPQSVMELANMLNSMGKG
jgi:hypothetical protein